MATSIWPIDWPSDATEGADPERVALAERFAASVLRFLTLGRVGGLPITVMPCGRGCRHPFDSGAVFHPVLLDSGNYANCWCRGSCSCKPVESVLLAAPVGRIDAVSLDGTTLDPSSYHVEDGNKLVRSDGGRWPSCAGENFTVTYLNAYPVDTVGAYAGGVLAAEYLKALSGDKKCRLPSNITSVARQGISYEVAKGMFPDGMTGLREVDTYIMGWNPHGMRTAPAVYSIDSPKQRQVTWP